MPHSTQCIYEKVQTVETFLKAQSELPVNGRQLFDGIFSSTMMNMYGFAVWAFYIHISTLKWSVSRIVEYDLIFIVQNRKIRKTCFSGTKGGFAGFDVPVFEIQIFNFFKTCHFS